MKWSTLLPLALSTFSLLPSTGAWEVTWIDGDNQKHSQSGTGPSDCIVIDNPKGNIFKIDSQGEKGINMLLFTNNKCDGKPSGMATDIFSKAASQDLLGFQVVALSTATTATATTGKSVSRVSTTFPASETASTSASEDGGSMTIQPTDSMTIQPTDEMSTTATATATATATTTSTAGSSSTASSTTSSAASAATPNAAGQLAASNGDMVKGLVGTVFGLGLVQWII